MRPETQQTAVDQLLASHEFTLQCAEESGLVSVDFTDEHKRWLAERIVGILGEKALSLDMNVPKVRLVVFKAVPSELSYEGSPCVDLDAKVMIFTTEGPKHFTWRIGILKGNTRFVEEVEGVADAVEAFSPRVVEPELEKPVSASPETWIDRWRAALAKCLKALGKV